MWTTDQTRILIKAYERGYSYRRMAFLTGKTEKQVNNKVFTMSLKRKYQKLEDIGLLGHLDIEASQLTANFGFMLSWAVKVDHAHVISDRLNEGDFMQSDKINTDKRIVKSLIDCLGDFDVITHYFGDYFDVPFIRSRCLKHRIKFPEYGSLYTVDVWRWAKRNLKLHSNRLESVAQHLGVNCKTKLDTNKWIRGTMGDMKSIEYIHKHNVKDVITLEKVYTRMKPYSSGVMRSI